MAVVVLRGSRYRLSRPVRHRLAAEQEPGGVAFGLLAEAPQRGRQDIELPEQALQFRQSFLARALQVGPGRVDGLAGADARPGDLVAHLLDRLGAAPDAVDHGAGLRAGSRAVLERAGRIGDARVERVLALGERVRHGGDVCRTLPTSTPLYLTGAFRLSPATDSSSIAR